MGEAVAQDLVEIGLAGIFDLFATDDVVGLDVINPARDVHVGIGKRDVFLVVDLEFRHERHGVLDGFFWRDGGRSGLSKRRGMGEGQAASEQGKKAEANNRGAVRHN